MHIEAVDKPPARAPYAALVQRQQRFAEADENPRGSAACSRHRLRRGRLRCRCRHPQWVQRRTL